MTIINPLTPSSTLLSEIYNHDDDTLIKVVAFCADQVTISYTEQPEIRYSYDKTKRYKTPLTSGRTSRSWTFDFTADLASFESAALFSAPFINAINLNAFRCDEFTITSTSLSLPNLAAEISQGSATILNNDGFILTFGAGDIGQVVEIRWIPLGDTIDTAWTKENSQVYYRFISNYKAPGNQEISIYTGACILTKGGYFFNQDNSLHDYSFNIIKKNNIPELTINYLP